MVIPLTRSTNQGQTHDYVYQSALFHFQALLLVILLFICTCTYVRAVAPRLVDRNKQGSVPFSSVATRKQILLIFFLMTPRFSSLLFKSARIGTFYWLADLTSCPLISPLLIQVNGYPHMLH